MQMSILCADDVFVLQVTSNASTSKLKMQCLHTLGVMVPAVAKCFRFCASFGGLSHTLHGRR